MWSPISRRHRRAWTLGVFGLVCPPSGAADPPLPFVADPALNELAPTLTPDGRTLFVVRWQGPWGSDAESPRTIYRSDLDATGWSEPRPTDFSGVHEDDDPFVSPAGPWLYFVSDRPAPGKQDRSGDIFRIDLAAGGVPERLPAPVNGPSAEYSPVVTAAGHLYFASDRPGGVGQGDLYRAPRQGEGFGEPELLGPAINSPTGEWNLWIDPAETELVFEASSRPTNVAVPGDLYLSVRGESGWTPALPLAELNTGGSDLLARVTPDGDTLLWGTAPIGGRAAIRRAAWPALRERTLAPLARTLLVAGRSSHEVSLISLRQGRTVASLPVARGPHLLSNRHDGLIAVTGYGLFPRPHAEPVAERPPFVDEPEPVLTLIDAAAGSIVHRWPLPRCRHPHSSLLVDGSAWVTCEDQREVIEIGLDDGAVRRRVPTGQAGSHVLARHGGILAVSNTDDGSVTLLDPTTGETTVVPLGAGAEGSAVVEARSELWVGNAGDGSLSVVDLSVRREVERIEGVCRMPIAMVAEGELVWVACFLDSELLAVDAARRSVTKRLPLTARPLNLLLHPELALAYVSLPRENAVAEIDLASGAETRRIPVGIEPDGLRWATP